MQPVKGKHKATLTYGVSGAFAQPESQVSSCQPEGCMTPNNIPRMGKYTDHPVYYSLETGLVEGERHLADVQT